MGATSALLEVKGATMTDAKPRLAVHVSAEFAVETDLDLEGFHGHGESVMEELLKLEACNDDFTDSTVSTDATRQQITIELYFFTDSTVTAVQRAFHLMRTAVHASGGSTPNWPDLDTDTLAEALSGADGAEVEYLEPSIQTEPALV